MTELPFPPCPACGSNEAIRIVYGLPTLDLSESAEREEVVLGGCVIGPESPEFACSDCGRELPWTIGAELGIG